MKSSISALLGGVVERLVDDALGGRAEQAGDLGAQLVADAAGGGGDVGVGLGLELGDLGVEAGPAVGEQRRGLRVGLGEQARALGLDVALRLADRAPPRRRRRRRLRRRRRARPGSVSVRSASAFLTSGPAFQNSRAKMITEASAAVDELGLLGPEPVMGDVALVVDRACALLGGARPATAVSEALIAPTPALIDVGDGAVDDASASGSPPGRQLAGARRRRRRRPSRRRPGPPSSACSTSAAAAARRSAMRGVDLGEALGALGLELAGGRPRCAAAPRPCTAASCAS